MNDQADNNVTRQKGNRRPEVFGRSSYEAIAMSKKIAGNRTEEVECDRLSDETIEHVERPFGGPGRRTEAETGRVNEMFESAELGSENPPEKGAREGSPRTGNFTKESDSKRSSRRHSFFENVKRKTCLCLDRPSLIRWVTLCLVGSVTFSIIYFLAGSLFVPGSQLFGLIVLFFLAFIGGALVKLIRLPSLLGMLLTGLLLRNIGFVHLEGLFTEITATLREIALCIILIRAGLGLDPKALKSLGFVILRLACIPGITEAMITTVVTHFFLGLPWLWGVLLGALLSAVSPAVVIPCLFSLQEKGYGSGKGIPTLVVAASSLDDILAISVFGVILDVIYSTDESLIMQVLQGPLGIVFGIAFGVIWGFIAHFVPHQKDKQVVLLRVLMILGGGLLAIIGSGVLGYQGAGPLGCIISAFVACLGWKKQDYSQRYNPVADVFKIIWAIFQPILFGLIGSEVDISVLDMSFVGSGFMALLCALFGRILVTIFIAFGVGFNWKEKIFIAFAWFPKATVQAALGPLALDLARINGSEEEVTYARKILMLAVLVILLTAPLGAVLIRILGPKLLTRDQEKLPPDEAINRESEHEMT